MNQIQGAIRYVKYLKEENNTPSIDIKLCTIQDALEKQVPKKVTRDSMYSPALCPTCHTSEICKDLGDGYYRYLTDIKYCPECGQLLDWD